MNPRTIAFACATVALTVALATPTSARPLRPHAARLEVGTLLAHPAGCPRIAFCGCGAASHLGLHDRRLWLARNWPRYYRGSTPVAVWRGHVAVIDHMTGPHTAMVYDYNSGGHRSRYWERDLRGARIVGGYTVTLSAHHAPTGAY